MKQLSLRFNLSGMAVDIRTTDDAAVMECVLFPVGDERIAESFTLPLEMFTDFFARVKENRV
jgi:hypothetical protein